ncbi:hypothetical protein M409DRAFT_52692 [Zasmidium cellare ATCC 36951]|uniref:Uncharacterized protein n=1 Tax=Zasmidium cellare ATCC 36951 TaxID=1080233 RepID=A0A6A6CQL9_ZASCE|nr:uncharacterized protein M409DRAFT_52692 [Zasmidium cellare ATCC 36951]KAF2169454.1 hypothetical protein M409DRAFT_52692 [Zasmidium cellare ATCC 36951]
MGNRGFGHRSKVRSVDLFTRKREAVRHTRKARGQNIDYSWAISDPSHFSLSAPTPKSITYYRRATPHVPTLRANNGYEDIGDRRLSSLVGVTGANESTTTAATAASISYCSRHSTRVETESKNFRNARSRDHGRRVDIS